MITEEERIHLKHTLALMNSMIKCGDEHSKASNDMLTESFRILLRESDPKAAEGKSYVWSEIKAKLDAAVERIQFHGRFEDRPDEDYWMVYSSLLKTTFLESL